MDKTDDHVAADGHIVASTPTTSPSEESERAFPKLPKWRFISLTVRKVSFYAYLRSDLTS
jgi:hypothetical protein